MDKNEIKKVLYKEKPMAKVTDLYRDGGSKDYEAETSLGIICFHVPIAEQRGSDGNVLEDFKGTEIPGHLLIRWITAIKGTVPPVLNHKEITGFDTPQEYMAYQKGREDEQKVIMKFIADWDGHTNSEAGALLRSKAKEILGKKYKETVEEKAREAWIQSFHTKRVVDISGFKDWFSKIKFSD